MNDKKKPSRWVHCWQSLMLLVVLFLSGCAAKELPFEIVGKELGSEYTDIDPDFWVLTSPEDMDTLKSDLPIPSAVSTELWVIDYQRYFVIVIWRGQLPVLSSKYIIEPNQVLRSTASLFLDFLTTQSSIQPGISMLRRGLSGLTIDDLCDTLPSSEREITQNVWPYPNHLAFEKRRPNGSQ